MTKTTLLLSCLCLSFAAVAATPAAAPASAPAGESKAHLRAAKERGSLMSACQQKATEQSLNGVERKQFLTSCMAGK
jgi:hypothetical protein